MKAISREDYNAVKALRAEGKQYPEVTYRTGISRASIGRIMVSKNYKQFRNRGKLVQTVQIQNIPSLPTASSKIDKRAFNKVLTSPMVTFGKIKQLPEPANRELLNELREVHKDLRLVLNILDNAHTYNIDDIPRPAQRFLNIFRRNK